EEVFGPVAAIIPFEDEADGIRIANDTPYGLSGSIWTRDAARAMRVARAIDTGVLALNSNTSVRVATPFGGFKQSGFGRELSMYGIPYLLEAGGGSVINVASFVAIVGAATSQISYTASKGAVLSMSRELAVQFARQGVRVNALCPGPVETPLLMRLFSETPGAYERRRMHLPMGRLAKA